MHGNRQRPTSPLRRLDTKSAGAAEKKNRQHWNSSKFTSTVQTAFARYAGCAVRRGQRNGTPPTRRQYRNMAESTDSITMTRRSSGTRCTTRKTEKAETSIAENEQPQTMSANSKLDVHRQSATQKDEGSNSENIAPPNFGPKGRTRTQTYRHNTTYNAGSATTATKRLAIPTTPITSCR